MFTTSKRKRGLPECVWFRSCALAGLLKVTGFLLAPPPRRAASQATPMYTTQSAKEHKINACFLQTDGEINKMSSRGGGGGPQTESRFSVFTLTDELLWGNGISLPPRIQWYSVKYPVSLLLWSELLQKVLQLFICWNQEYIFSSILPKQKVSFDENELPSEVKLGFSSINVWILSTALDENNKKHKIKG